MGLELGLFMGRLMVRLRSVVDAGILLEWIQWRHLDLLIGWLMAMAADEASAGVVTGEADWAANGVPCWADEVASSTTYGNGWSN